VADLLGVAGAGAEPERQVAAEIGADGGHGQPGGGQRPAVAGPAASPGGQRAEEQRGRAALAGGVHQADPLLVGVQRGPVSQPGSRRRDGAGQAGPDEHAGGAAGAGDQVEQHGRRPAPEWQPDQRGVRRLAERDTVQRVGPGAGRQGAYHAVGQPADDRVEHMGLLDALGQGRGPPEGARLAVRARPAGGGGG
jgi:hypothetical protein